jgi:hypothetical protein
VSEEVSWSLSGSADSAEEDEEEDEESGVRRFLSTCCGACSSVGASGEEEGGLIRPAVPVGV